MNESSGLFVPSAADVVGGANVVPVEAGQDWAREAAAFVVDQAGGSDVAVLRDVQPHRRHGVYEMALSETLVFGHHHLHAFLTSPDRFDCQEIEHYRRRLDYHVDNHPGRQLPMPQIHRVDGRFEVSYRNLAGLRIADVGGRVVFGTPTEPLNWGMWILQALPIAAGFVAERSADRMLIHAGRPWQLGLLAAAGLSAREIVHQELGHTYYCRDLRVTQYTQVDLVPTPSDRALYARIGRTLAPQAGSGRKRRIFLSRRSVSKAAANYRALTNEDELIDRMAELGFEIHEPEQLAFADQIALFREAEMVVGLGGAALFNVVFCEPGTSVVSIESSSIFIHNHAMLFGSLGHRFGFILGTQDESDPTPIHKRWSVDVAGVVRTLRRI